MLLLWLLLQVLISVAWCLVLLLCHRVIVDMLRWVFLILVHWLAVGCERSERCRVDERWGEVSAIGCGAGAGTTCGPRAAPFSAGLHHRRLHGIHEVRVVILTAECGSYRWSDLELLCVLWLLLVLRSRVRVRMRVCLCICACGCARSLLSLATC